MRKLASFSQSRNLWSFHDIPLGVICTRTWNSALADRLFGRAAELGFYFLFALFPTLFCAGSILGLAARSVHQISDELLDYLALIIPTTALGIVLKAFNETTSVASSTKVTFGSIASIWSASIGISAIQDTLNELYKIDDKRSYIVARFHAIILTIVLTTLFVLALACMFGGDLGAALAQRYISDRYLAIAAAVGVRIVAWTLASCVLALAFGALYRWAPDWKERKWRWLTPGIGVGILGWILASLGFRIYLHFFSNYTITYGSLGAVIILLTWFYISGLMILLGAEIDRIIDEEIDASIPTIISEKIAPEDWE
ncbi:MAG TPA: YihY/virulence factor BrkB family protein [Terracidiphilus sp.]|jgi:membrane protein|nr:YihY/virulence factor BrkB family protein [Terracidiphilus sp.]